MNCLEFALNEWDNDPIIIILYDGDHVICLNPDTGKIWDQNGNYERFVDPTRFLPLREYGYHHLAKSFSLSWHYDNWLRKYLRVPNESATNALTKVLTDYYYANKSLEKNLDWATAYYNFSEEQLFKFIKDENEDDPKLHTIIEYIKTNLK